MNKYSKALKEIQEVKRFLKTKPSLIDAKNKLKGANFYDDMFDFDKDTITGTIAKRKNGELMLINDFQVWNKSNNEFENLKESEIKSRIK